MENSDILVDTSVIIAYLRKKKKEDTLLYKLAGSYQLYTSSVVEFELFCGALDKKKHQSVEEVLSAFTILPFSSDISQEAAHIYKYLKQNNLLIEIRDIFIAATAVVNNMPLVTVNKKHFYRINQLQLLEFNQ
jgi:tRNA(fMet)-specific endonuclease VapC